MVKKLIGWDFIVDLAGKKDQMIQFVETDDEVIIRCAKKHYGFDMAMEQLMSVMGMTGEKHEAVTEALKRRFGTRIRILKEPIYEYGDE